MDAHGGCSPQGQGTAATQKNKLCIDSVGNRVLIVVFSGGKRKSVDKESSATTAEGDPLQCLTIFS